MDKNHALFTPKKKHESQRTTNFISKWDLINQEICILLKDSKCQGDGFYEWLRKIGGAPYVVLSLVYMLLSNGC